MRKKGLKLFPKTFLYALSLILAVVCFSYLLIYLLMPQFYYTYKERELEERTNALCAQISVQEPQQFFGMFYDFCRQSGYALTVEDASGEVLFASQYASTVQIETENTGSADHLHFSADEYDLPAAPDDELRRTMQAYTIEGTALRITASSGLQPINEAKGVILMTLPCALAICALLSAVVSFFYARAISKPIETLSASTVRMRGLDRGIRCTLHSADEIGILSENINALYETLLSTIDSLQDEIRKTSDAERRKLDFMITASHELKTPITAVRGMVEGMFYRIGVYQDRDTYLEKCLKSLDELSALLCEILDTSRLDVSDHDQEFCMTDIGALTEEVLDHYRVIAQSGQRIIYTDIPHTVNVLTAPELLSRALSNIISNSVRYTPCGGEIRIYFKNNSLLIENQCTPLSDEELRHIFEPFYRPDFSHSRESGGNGLGLYITDRILKTCRLQYAFYAAADGMVFRIDF